VGAISHLYIYLKYISFYWSPFYSICGEIAMSASFKEMDAKRKEAFDLWGEKTTMLWELNL
jgi:hypothetical protein